MQLDQLKTVGAEAKLPPGIATTRRAFVKQITQFIDKVIDEEEEDVAMHQRKTMLKKHYDRKTYGAELQPGCQVLVRDWRDRGGPGKGRSYWEEQVHIVTERKHEDSPG